MDNPTRLFIQKTGTVSVAAQTAWELLADWGAVTKWLRGFDVTKIETTGKLGDVPRVRTLWIAGGMVAKETLIAIDHRSKRLYYRLDDGGIPGLTNYVATTFIDEIDANHCRIGCASMSDAPSGEAESTQLRGFLENFYEQGFIGGFAHYFSQQK